MWSRSYRVHTAYCIRRHGVNGDIHQRRRQYQRHLEYVEQSAGIGQHGRQLRTLSLDFRTLDFLVWLRRHGSTVELQPEICARLAATHPSSCGLTELATPEPRPTPNSHYKASHVPSKSRKTHKTFCCSLGFAFAAACLARRRYGLVFWNVRDPTAAANPNVTVAAINLDTA